MLIVALWKCSAGKMWTCCDRLLLIRGVSCWRYILCRSKCASSLVPSLNGASTGGVGTLRARHRDVYSSGYYTPFLNVRLDTCISIWVPFLQLYEVIWLGFCSFQPIIVTLISCEWVYGVILCHWVKESHGLLHSFHCLKKVFHPYYLSRWINGCFLWH